MLNDADTVSVSNNLLSKVYGVNWSLWGDSKHERILKVVTEFS